MKSNSEVRFESEETCLSGFMTRWELSEGVITSWFGALGRKAVFCVLETLRRSQRRCLNLLLISWPCFSSSFRVDRSEPSSGEFLQVEPWYRRRANRDFVDTGRLFLRNMVRRTAGSGSVTFG